MTSVRTKLLLLWTAAVLLGLVSLALAHDDHGTPHGGGADMLAAKEHPHSSPSSHDNHYNNGSASTSSGKEDAGRYYFALASHRGWLYLHILTMLFGWVIVMPLATTLSLAGSRHHLPVQISFLATNAVGLVFSAIHARLVAEDLYPGASHRKLGWTLLVILGVQAAVGVLARVGRNAGHREGFVSVPSHDRETYPRLYRDRRSADSGHGGSMDQDDSCGCSDDDDDHDDDHGEWANEKPAGPRRRRRWTDLAALENAVVASLPALRNGWALRVCDRVYSVIAGFLVPLGFTQICLGVVTGSGIFMGSSVFNGLAHFTKGGIFFLYGILTLGRWLGAYSELGWSWNIKPGSSRVPSCETLESGGIFIYGCANSFLEHLASWGGEWSHSDLQHVSIAFMFLGGGLLGLLLESKRIRRVIGSDYADHGAGFTLNPLPALVIFLLGILMSRHHQHSRLSSTIHTQWGILLAAAAVFRWLTYIVFFLAPPRSTAPTRPPTEVMTAFCLIAGGLVFMCSSRDTVNYLERIGVDAMFSLTVTVGVTALCMSWVTVVVAVGAWARERKAAQEAEEDAA